MMGYLSYSAEEVDAKITQAKEDVLGLVPSPEPAVTERRIHDGKLKITEDGATVSDLDIYGDLVLDASNVVVRNCRIRGNDASKILVQSFRAGAVGNRLIKCHIEPDFPAADQVGIHGNASTLHCEIVGTTDGINIYRASNVAHVGNLIHGLRWWDYSPHHGAEGTHSDGIQVFDGDRVLIAGNTIHMDVPNTSAIILTQGDPIRNISIMDNNLLGRAPAAINISDKGKGAITGRVIGNRISKGYGYDILISAPSKPSIDVVGNFVI
jgi:hypothetical protein